MEHTTKPGAESRPGTSLEGVAERGKTGASLDTLAQPCSSEGNPQNLLKKRARAKYLSLPLACSLARLETPLQKSYWNTYHCAGAIIQEGGKLTSKYCGNRWCMVCNRIRTARAINAYVPVVETWGESFFVTLTLRTVTAEELPERIESMLKVVKGIGRSVRETHKLPFQAIRKLEVTSRPGGLYHPHLHLVVEGREQAELLRSLWLKRYPMLATAEAQNVVSCNEGTLVELFKYFTKLTTKTVDGKRIIPVVELDTIFRAMRGRRVWQPMGFRLPKEIEEAIETEAIEVDASDAVKRIEETVDWQWSQQVADWVDHETGECLSEYEPGGGFRSFVESVAGGLTTLEVDSPTMPVESMNRRAITAEIQPVISAMSNR
jgi:hypothetical protein